MLGKIAVMIVGILMIACYFVPLQVAHFLLPIFMGGFIGGFTNSVAIKMLFEKKWYLPGSGIMLKEKDFIVEKFSTMAEKHILSQVALRAKFHEIITSAINDDVLRGRVKKHVNGLPLYYRLVDVLKENSGIAGTVANSTGIMTYEVMAHKVLDKVENAIDQVSSDNVPVEKVDEVIEQIVDVIDIKELARENLSKLTPEKMRDVVEKATREHLFWLEVFGVILGCLFSLILKLIGGI